MLVRLENIGEKYGQAEHIHPESLDDHIPELLQMKQASVISCED